MRQQVQIGVRTLVALAVVLGLVGIVISSVSASSGNSGKSVAVSSQDAPPSETGTITVVKRFCEEEESPSENTTCNGRVAPEGVEVTFTVTDGEDTVVDTIVVDEFDQGAGSQGTGQATGTDLEADQQFTVCETPVEGFVAVPVPGDAGGTDQTPVQGTPCIIVDLVPGNNVLNFNNFQDAAAGDVDGDEGVPGDDLPDTGHGPTSAGDTGGMTTMMLGASAASLLAAGWLQLRFRGAGVR